MSDRPVTDSEISSLREVDRVATDFEDAWRAGQAPRTEEFLNRSSHSNVDSLTAELLRIEIECRREQGDGPTPDELAARFPGYDLNWADFISETPGNEPPPEIEGYAIEREVARGGMGIVYRAREAAFDRPLAIKVLRQRAGAGKGHQRRLLGEADVMGRLQHPGIPAVYAKGETRDGRAYYAMKLVEGKTLSRMLADAEQDTSRLLEIFGHVCETVAYAHSVGIVHRDLKPGNVMVGEFGEVRVMDWGMAKLMPLDKPQVDKSVSEDTAAILDTVSEHIDEADLRYTFGHQTVGGDVMGTLPYMPPEQANGDIDEIDQASDVFALGSMLCELLTGKPAYWGDHPLEKARAGELQDAWDRIDDCDADPELKRIARQCLAHQKANRFGDAQLLAAAIHEHQQQSTGRLQRERIDEATSFATSSVAARKRVWQFVGMGAIVLLIGLCAWGFWEHEQVKETRHDAFQASIRYGDLACEQGGWEEAGRHYDTAEKHMRPNNSHLQKILRERRRELFFAKQLELIRSRRMVTEGGEFRVKSQGFDGDYAHAFQRHFPGINISASVHPQQLTRAVSESRVRNHLIDALDDWSTEADPIVRDYLHQVLTVADSNPYRNAIRAKVRENDIEGLVCVTRGIEVEDVRAPVCVMAARALHSAGRIDDAIDLLTTTVAQSPKDFWANLYLGVYLHFDRDRRTQAQQYYRAATTCRGPIAVAYANLGNVHLSKRKYSQAEECFRQAIRADADIAVLHIRLAETLRLQERWELSEASLREAIRLDSNSVTAHFNLALLLSHLERWHDAHTAYREVLGIKNDHFEALDGLGYTLVKLGKPDDAIRVYQSALIADPEKPGPHAMLGDLLRKKGEFRAALDHYREVLRAARTAPRFDEPARENIALCQQFIRLERQVLTVLRNPKAVIDADRLANLAGFLLEHKKQPRLACRFYLRAFRAKPALERDIAHRHRYRAIQAASMSLKGLAGKDRSGFARMVCRWLKAEAVDRRRQLSPAQRRELFAAWLADKRLQTVRDPELLAKLDAACRRELSRFWSQIALAGRPPLHAPRPSFVQ